MACQREYSHKALNYHFDEVEKKLWLSDDVAVVGVDGESIYVQYDDVVIGPYVKD